MLGGATQAMPLCIVEERQQRRRPLAATPLGAAAHRAAGRSSRWLCCSLLTYHTGHTGYARRSRLASGPGGQQQSANVILRRALGMRMRKVDGVFVGLTAVAVLLIVAMLGVIVGDIVIYGWERLTWEFLTASPRAGMTEGGIFPAIFGTALLVLLMTIFVVPM